MPVLGVPPPPVVATFAWVGLDAPEPLPAPEPPEPLLFVECPGFAWATKPASAPTRATAPTQAHFVRLDARRKAASRACRRAAGRSRRESIGCNVAGDP